jgi:GTP:adenosylcobinamide-phosphate guanylyltransferase
MQGAERIAVTIAAGGDGLRIRAADPDAALLPPVAGERLVEWVLTAPADTTPRLH